ncbi:MAG: methyl-accepting chemotaxis protein, partial [Lachnospiraceae bacterium]|nr:methyl-accepting chemotaxis protein [Lachnospiraceae bacterium]
QAENVQKEYSNVLNQNIVALQTFANAESTREYIENLGTANQKVTDAEMLKEMEAINTYINDGNTSVVLDALNGDSILRLDGKSGNNIGDRDYFQACVSNKAPFISNIILAKTTGNRVQNIIVPIFDESGTTVIATVHRSYNLKTLHNFLADNVSDGYITDRTGLMAAHAQFELTAEDEYDMSSAEFITTNADSGLFNMAYTGVNTYTSWVREPVSGYVVTVSQTETDIMFEARRTAVTVAVLGVILIVVAVVISIIMARSFTNPIAAVADSLAALADGRFVAVEKHDKRKDEFGVISGAANTVISKLDEIVSNIKTSAGNVGNSSDELSDMATQISQTAEDVSNAVQEIASGATQQAEEIQEANDNVTKIGEAVSDVQTSSVDLLELASKMKKASEVSSNSLNALKKSSTEMTEKIDEISRTIQATEEAVNNISEKVEGITSIASQTNLLSLNASIEAARAGEMGKGFAVVAEEIGKLADDSGHMADEIRIEMEKLLNQSREAVEAAKDVKEGNNSQQVALDETLEAVDGMLEDINTTVDGVNTISEGATTCDNSKNSLIDTMSALSAISEENAASSEETGASMQELSATVTTLAGAAADLKDIAEKLNEDMKFFKS